MTDTDIANLALVKLGVSPIGTLTETSDQAVVANRFYATTRDGYLSSYPWIFATVRGLELSIETATPDTEWSHQAPLPADLLRLLKVHNNGAPCPYDLVATKRVYLSSNSDVFVDYIREVQEADFPSYFVTAFSWMLAADMALTLTEDARKLQVVTDLAQFWDRKARYLDSAQQPSRHFPVGRLTGVRF